jgi:CubicO group peptidase (beta-lactamase class C family)
LTGKNWGAFLKERIFDPLEMENTRINRLDEIVPHRASGYWIVSRDIVVNGPPVSPSMMAYAAGGLRSTVIDLMKWDAALDSGKILNLKQLQQMWQPTPLNNGTTTPYGLGWSVKDYNGQRMISHSGGRESGYSTYMAKFPDHRLTIILLTNQYNGASPRDLAKTIVELVLPQLAAEPTDFMEK